MSIQRINQLFPDDSDWEKHCNQLQQVESFSHLIWLSLQVGLWVARWIAQTQLNQIGEALTPWPSCQLCGHPLQSKGLRNRQMITLIGVIRWHRRVGRCRHGCKGSQRIPSDEALAISLYQATDEGLMRLGCLFSLMLPYQMASWLLGQWNGVTVSASALWNEVQRCGAAVMVQLEQDIKQYQHGQRPEPEPLSQILRTLTLAVSADGVMVPMRPQPKTAKGRAE